MSEYLKLVTTNVTNFANWAHQSIKELPVAGHVYDKFNEWVSLPAWNLGCRVKDIATPILKNARAIVEPHVRKHPIISGVLIGTALLIVFHRVANYNWPTSIVPKSGDKELPKGPENKELPMPDASIPNGKEEEKKT